MSTYVDKQPLSLIERKKQQWAKEREELAALGASWSAPKEQQTYDRPLQRNRYVSTFAMSKNNEIFRQDNPADNYPNNSRRSSLPPLYKNQQQQYNNNTTDRSDIMMDKGGETSGYGSDNNPNQNCDNNSNTRQSINQYWNHQSGYESSSSYKDDRLKWPKDQKHLWVMKGENEPPNWVKRGLQNDEEIVVVSNSSPAESPQHDDIDDRPYTGCSNSMHKSYIRGQNIPVDSIELAEREKRRQIALAHQEAVRQQLHEREERRRHEREQRIREEREEELRIEREQEIERQRKEHELRLMKEKQEREQKRKQAIQEAIRQAEKEAQLEKIKLKVLKQNNSEDNEIKINNIIKEKGDTNGKGGGGGGGSNEVGKNDGNLHQKQEIVLNNEINNNLDLEKNNRPKSVNEKRPETLNAISNNNNNNNKVPASVQILQTPRSENLALVVQTPIENLQNLQYAVLVSNLGGTSAIPIAIPVVPTTTDTPPRTENRLLTPTLYRNRNKKLCDCSTQTDSIEINNNNNNETRCIKDKLTNLDYDNRTMCRKQKVVEERPKWNANRPPTRYMKQSEKDPLYQRRKLRQKTRDCATKENSSDDSQTNSPRSYRKRNFIEKRHHTRALWRKNDNYFARNIRMYQTEIVPLDSDKDQIYYHRHHNNHHCCRCNCGDGGSRIDILKIEHNSSTPLSTTREQILPNCSRNLENTDCLIDKLTSLHNDLFIKQEQWEKSPRTPNLSSSTTTRNTAENN